MSPALVGVVVLLALPAGWWAGVLYDRIPPNEPLLADLPGPRLTGAYGWIHVVTLGLFLAMAWRFSDRPWAVLGFYLLLALSLTALSAIDLATLRLPDKLVVPSILVGIVWVTATSIALREAPQARYALAGGALYFVFLLVTHLAFPRGMGFGDVKLSALMGLAVGWLADSYTTSVILVLYAALAGFVVGAFVGVVIFAFRRKSRPIPFGPFLAFGTLLIVLVSPQLLSPVT